MGPFAFAELLPAYQWAAPACLAERRAWRHTLCMLARYQIVRGKRAPDDPLPDGKRVDTRKHTRHFLRPDAAEVDALLADVNATTHAHFARAYDALLTQRFRAERAPFDALAELAQHEDVYLGCSCPSSANPDVQRCHTVLALRFMKKQYPTLNVVLP